MTEHRRRARSAPLVVAVVALALLAACTSGGEAGPDPSTTSSSGTPSAAPKVARIGVISSSTGALAAAGKPVRDSVELAVREANSTEAVPGWVFDAVPANDSSTQSGGQQAASGLAADDRIIGVVGGRSLVDEGVQPILNNAGVPFVSPAGTAATLTRRLDGGILVRPFPTYFRLSPTDADQGTAAARYAKSSLDAKRVAVVDDGTSYGRLISGTFAAEAKRLKLARPVERTVSVTEDTAAAAAKARRERVADAIAAANVDVVFFGGTAEAAAGFAQSLQLAGVTEPVIGGDALLDGTFLTDLGVLAAEGDHAVFPGAPAVSLPSARGYVRRFRAAGFGPDPGAYGASAYDATQAIIRAFAASVGDATTVDPAVRRGVVEQLDVIAFEGATGPVSFDRFGDAKDRPLAVYEVVGRVWDVAGIVRVG